MKMAVAKTEQNVSDRRSLEREAASGPPLDCRLCLHFESEENERLKIREREERNEE
jgi:hypothetical protein